MDKQKTAAVFPIVTKKAIEEDIGQMIETDSREKKRAIYHRPAKGRAKEPEQMQCDEYCIKLGYPMSYGEYSVLSDETRKMYIGSILDTYPGISINSIATMLDVAVNTVKKEFDRLGIMKPTGVSRHLQTKYCSEINMIKDKMFRGELPRNLVYNGGGSGVDLKRISYDDLKKMDKKDQISYINGIYNKYFRCLSVGDFSILFKCSDNTINRTFKSLGIKFGTVSKGFSRSENSKKIREQFRKEMLSEEEYVVTSKKNDYLVNSVDITVDIDTADIGQIIKSIGLNGKIRVRVERVM